MFRLIKIIFLFLFVIAALYFGASVFIPAKYTIERTETLNAPVDIVFEQVSHFKNWEKWSPWKEKDPEMKALFGPNDGKTGSYWLWKSSSGDGRMTSTNIIDQKEINYHLSYSKPYPSESDGSIKLEAQDNMTKVTWTMEGSNPFHLRVLNLLMDKKIGPDFEKGLQLLKVIAEKEASIFQNEYYGYRIKETRFGGSKIGFVRETVLFEEMDEFFTKNYAKIKEEATNCGFRIDGEPMALFYRWDYTNTVANIAAAIPIMGDSTLGNDCEMMQLQPQQALLLNYYGGYKSSANAYKALDNYVRNKKLRTQKPVIEEYIIGPKQQRDSSKWFTKIWYLLDK
jgi:effector-binding domain-containing protein